MALRFVDNYYFKQFLKFIRPLYKPPSSYTIGTPILNMEFERTTEENAKLIKESTACGLLTDGQTQIMLELPILLFLLLLLYFTSPLTEVSIEKILRMWLMNALLS